MLGGDSYAKRKNRLGLGSTRAVSSYSKGDGSAPIAGWVHPCQRAVGLSLQSLTSTCPVLCARHWSCLQGWFDQFPASCWVPRGRSIISDVHVSSRNPEPQVLAFTWLVFSTTMTHHKFVLFLFQIGLCEFWGNSVFVLQIYPEPFHGMCCWSAPVAHKHGTVALLVALWRI